MKLVYSPLMGGLLHLIQRGGDWAELQPTQAPPRCTNVTAHSSVASVPITVLLYNGPLLCGFSVHVKGLTNQFLTYLPCWRNVDSCWRVSWERRYCNWRSRTTSWSASGRIWVSRIVTYARLTNLPSRRVQLTSRWWRLWALAPTPGRCVLELLIRV